MSAFSSVSGISTLSRASRFRCSWRKRTYVGRSEFSILLDDPTLCQKLRQQQSAEYWRSPGLLLSTEEQPAGPAAPSADDGDGEEGEVLQEGGADEDGGPPATAPEEEDASEPGSGDDLEALADADADEVLALQNEVRSGGPEAWRQW